MYRCIIEALSFCSQVFWLPLFLSKKKRRSGFMRLRVAILCGRVWGDLGTRVPLLLPSPGVTHCPPLQTPFTHTSSKRSNRLACVPCDTPSIPYFLSLFNRARVANCTEISHKSSQKARKLSCWISKRRTIRQPKWNEWKQNFREETFVKLGTPRVVVLFFPKFWQLLVCLILEVARNLNRRF